MCCTVGAGSFLDNSDKSSLSHQKKNANRNSRASSQQTKEKTTSTVESNNKVIPVPPIITNPTELDNLSNPTNPDVAAVKASTPTPTNTNYNNNNNNNNNNINTTEPDHDESSTSPISLPPQTSPVVSYHLYFLFIFY